MMSYMMDCGVEVILTRSTLKVEFEVYVGGAYVGCGYSTQDVEDLKRIVGSYQVEAIPVYYEVDGE